MWWYFFFLKRLQGNKHRRNGRIEKSPFKIDIPWSNDPEKFDYNSIFFEHFFPDLTGKAKIIDRFFDDVWSPMYATVQSDNIKFHRPDDKDPNHLVSVTFISYLMHKHTVSQQNVYVLLS